MDRERGTEDEKKKSWRDGGAGPAAAAGRMRRLRAGSGGLRAGGGVLPIGARRTGGVPAGHAPCALCHVTADAAPEWSPGWSSGAARRRPSPPAEPGSGTGRPPPNRRWNTDREARLSSSSPTVMVLFLRSKVISPPLHSMQGRGKECGVRTVRLLKK